jgi:glycosyltransferase involved in cell wall biosynthesis
MWFVLETHCGSSNRLATLDQTSNRPRQSLVASPNKARYGQLSVINKVLSICITVKNRSIVREAGHELRLFPNCVDSIVRSASTDSNIEVVVADWHSDDWPLKKWFEGAIGSVPHRVIEVEGDFCRGKGRNRAAKAARGEGLFFVDADCTIETSVCAAASRCVEQGMAYFPVVYSYDSPAHTTGWWRHTGYGNCALPREVFERTGGWPEYDRWGKEDDDFFAKVSSLVAVVRQETPGFYHQWHPDTVLWKDRYTAHFPWMLDEFKRREVALTQLKRICRDGNPFILVDEARFGNDPLPGYEVFPFTEDDGHYGGPPPDDATAIRELERMRKEGAQFIAFAWMSYWWLEYYDGFARYLETNYSRKLTTPDVVVFDLSDHVTASR